MPYISKYLRENLEIDFNPADAGELNYSITKIVDDYLSINGVNYSNINEVIGVLECAKLEIYRRIAAPYEDSKIEENGDVYESIWFRNNVR